MGKILSVRDPDLHRELAAKVLLGGVSGDRRKTEKFLIEAQITGQLEHPNIVPVHELGATPDGRAYFTMKRVRGRDFESLLREAAPSDLAAATTSSRRRRAGATSSGVRRKADEPSGRPESLAQHLEIFLKVCDAIAFAHSRGVIHRDLKPANIMVGEFGEVLVMDWGLAKAIDHPDSTAGSVTPDLQGGDVARRLREGIEDSEPLRTLDGTLLGTPAYMPPEQARGQIEKLDERSDIYSLGAILYQILTLSPPFTGKTPWAIVEQVTRGKLVPPSERARGRTVPRELEAVVLKAMSPNRAKRYTQVTELRADISAYLSGHTLSAARYTPWQRAAKWVGRHRAVTAVTAAAAVVVLALSSTFVWRLELRRREAEEARDEESRAKALAEEERGMAERQAALAEARAHEAAIRLGEALDEKGRSAMERFAWQEASIYLANALEIEERPDRRFRALEALSKSWTCRASVLEKARYIWSLGWTPEGTLLATGTSSDGALEAWNAETGAPLWSVPSEAGCTPKLSPRGGEIVALSSSGQLSIREARTGVQVSVVEDTKAGFTPFWSQDGSTIAGVVLAAGTGAASEIRIWHMGTGEPPSSLPVKEGQTVTSLALSPHGQRVALCGAGPLSILDASSGEEVQTLTGHLGFVTGISWSPDGLRLASGGQDETARIWDASSGRQLALLSGHRNGAGPPVWSPTGDRLAVVSGDGSIHVWDARSGRTWTTIEGGGAGTSLAWSSDGQRFAAASLYGTVRVWEVDPPSGVTLLDNADSTGVSSLTWSPRGGRLAGVSFLDQSVSVWDSRTGDLLTRGLGKAASLVSWAPDESHLAILGNPLLLSDLENGRTLASLEGGENPFTSVAWSPASDRVAIARRDSKLEIRNGSDGSMVHALEARAGLGTIFWSPDGARLAFLGTDSNLQIVDVARREIVAQAPAGGQLPMAWSPDSSRIAYGPGDGAIRILDGRTGELQTQIEGSPLRYPFRIAWSPDGKRIAAVLRDGSLEIVEDARRETLIEPTAPSGSGPHLYWTSVWSANGTQLLVALGNGAIRAIRFPDRTEIGRLEAGYQAPFSWSGEGSRIAIPWTDSRVGILERNLLFAPAARLRELAEERTRLRLDRLSAIPIDLPAAPTAPSQDPRAQEVQAYIRMGDQHVRQAQLDQALDNYRKALELDPENANAHVGLSWALLEKKDHDGAIREADRALELDPRCAMAYNNRGVAKRALGDVIGAIDDFTRAIEIDDRNVQFLANRGGARQARGDIEGAFEDYTRAIEAYPGYAWAYASRGLLFENQGDLAKAIDDYDRAIEFDPKYAWALVRRAESKKRGGQLEEALRDYDRAVELEPTNANHHNDRGIVSENLGDLEGALGDYDRAIELEPNLWTAWWNRARLKARAGDAGDARRCFDRALDLCPEEKKVSLEAMRDEILGN